MLCEGRVAPCSLPHGVSVCGDSCVCVCVCAHVCAGWPGPLPRNLARSHRSCRLGLKSGIEGFRTEADHTHPLLLPCPQVPTQASTWDTHLKKKTKFSLPQETGAYTPNKDSASYCTTFSRLPSDTQVLFVWKFISTGGFKEGPLDTAIDPVLCLSCFLMFVCSHGWSHEDHNLGQDDIFRGNYCSWK